jgi:cytochrome c peroxidase
MNSVNQIKYTGIIILFIGIMAACSKDPDFDRNFDYNAEFGTLPEPIYPPDNKLTTEGVKLGRMLFYEKALSKNMSMSCATCHQQKNAFSDTNRYSIGVRGLPGNRQAMAVFNMLWNTRGFFWDGRAATLREQSLKPIEDHLEMDETLEQVVEKLKNISTYRVQFRKAFGTEEINPLRMSLALEQFMFSIVSHHSKYDDYVAGKVNLTPQEERGRFLFFTEFNPAFPAQSGADCQHCHSGANFEDDRFHNNGLDSTLQIVDPGLQAVSGNASDRGKFKTPSLRNIALTFPYMHDGRFRTLEEVVDHYNMVTPSSTLDPTFLQQIPGGLKLSQSDKAALVAFLKTLTDEQLIQDERYSDPF